MKRKSGNYWSSIEAVPGYRHRYIILPIMKTTEPMTNAERLEVWRLVRKSSSHIMLPVLNRRT